MKPPVVSEAEALKASRQMRPWMPGWYSGRIDSARETLSKAQNECFELNVIVRNPSGEERTFRDWLTATKFGLLKLVHAIGAVGLRRNTTPVRKSRKTSFRGTMSR
jgi:hypothetical protein